MISGWASIRDNWLGGLAMQMAGPTWLRLLLNGFVVFVGFLILSGAVNTSIVGSNGVLNRVAEDGVLPDWFLKPHRRYGTTSRVLWLITGMQLFTIIVSRGDVIMLGEAYAFGVVWSFVFKTLSMVVLRFKDHSPREFLVPLNFRWGNTHVPVGLSIVFLIVFLSAIANFVTKPVATISGLVFHRSVPRCVRDYRKLPSPQTRLRPQTRRAIQSSIRRSGDVGESRTQKALSKTGCHSFAA